MKVDIRKMVRGDKAAVMKILRATPEFLPAEILIAEEVIDCYLRTLRVRVISSLAR